MIERPTRFITQRPHAPGVSVHEACAPGITARVPGILAHAPGILAHAPGITARAPVGAVKVKLREATLNGAGRFFPA